MNKTELPEPIRAVIRRAAGMQRQRALAEAIGVALASIVVLFVCSVFLDRFVELPAQLKVVLPVVTFGVPTLRLLVRMFQLLRPRSDDDVAGMLDRLSASNRDLIRSAVNFNDREADQEGQIHPFMLSGTVHAAESLSQDVSKELSALVGWGAVPKQLIRVLAGLVVVGGLAAWPFMDMDVLVTRFLDPLGNHPRPSQTQIAVDATLEQTITQGDDLLVSVQLSGVIPESGGCTLKFLSEPGADAAARTVLMTPRPQQRYQARLRELQRATRFVVEAGDGRTAIYQVHVRPRPAIKEMRVRYDFPRYTRLKRQEATLKTPEFKGVEGTRVRVEFDASMVVAESKVMFPERSAKIRWDRQRKTGSFQFVIERDTTFRVFLKSELGTDNGRDRPYKVRVLPDNPPSISVFGMPEPPTVFRESILDLRYDGTDDYGLAELYLRAYRGFNDPRPEVLSVQLAKSNLKKAEGNFSLEIAELVDENVTQLQLELVAVDSKGQEVATPRFELQIISDTPDRQLAELVEMATFYQETYWAGRQSLRGMATALRSSAGRIGVVLDGMDANTKLKGSKRQQIVNQVFVQLSNIRIHDPDEKLYVSEYPYLSQRRAEFLMTMPMLMHPSAYYVALRDEINATELPYEKLKQVKAILESQSAIADSLLAAFEDSLEETRIRYVGVLASKLARDQQRALAATNASEELKDRLRQKLSESLEKLFAMTEVIKDEGILKAIQAVKKANDAGQEVRDAAVTEAIVKLRDTVLGADALDGRLGKKIQASQLSFFNGDWVRTALAQGNAERTTLALAECLRLRRDSQVPDEAETLLYVQLYEAVLTGDMGRIDAVIKSFATLYPWAIRFELLERCQLLKLWVHELQIDLAVGRLSADNPKLDQSWQEIRELLLSIVRDHNAGRFTGAFDMAPHRGALAPYVALFRSWYGGDVVGRPEFAEQCKGVENALNGLITALEAAVVKETQQVMAGSGALFADIAKNLHGTPQRIAAERKAIVKEVADAEEEFLNLVEGTEKHRRWVWRRGTVPRLQFSADLVRRITCHSVAATKLMDLQEWLWARTSVDAQIPELEARAILVEYLGHLEEEVYDEAVGRHTNRSHGTYPKYLWVIDKFYESYAPLASTIGDWFQTIGAGKSVDLLKVEAFSQVLVKSKKTQRFKEAMKTINDHAAFVKRVQGIDEAGRAPILHALSESKHPSVYWDRVYVESSHLAAVAAGVEAAMAANGWQGMAPELAKRSATLLARLRVIVPAEAPDSLQPLAEIRDEWAGIAAKLSTVDGKAPTDSEREQLKADVQDWHARMLGIIRGFSDAVAVTQAKARVRRRYKKVSRLDIRRTIGRIIRAESRWTQRLGRAARHTYSRRAQMLGPNDSPATLTDISWAFSLQQRNRRRSAAIMSQKSRGLGGDAGDVDERFLKMPKYLYKELMRAAKRPYPTQFREPGLSYIQTLIEEAR